MATRRLSTNPPPARVLLPTDLAALYLQRPAATIRRWAHEGRITNYGTSQRGGARYDLTELHEVAADLRLDIRQAVVNASA